MKNYRHTKKSRKFSFGFLGFLFILISFFLVGLKMTKGAADSTFYFNPATDSVEIDTNFSLDARIDPGANSVTAVELHVTFDGTKLRLDSITPNATDFPDELQAADIDNVNGTASITLGIGASGTNITADASVAVFNFHSLAIAIDSPVGFTVNSQAAAEGETGDVIVARDASLVSVTDSSDVTGPVLSEVTPVSDPTNDTTPSYTFTSDEDGTIAYGGDCSSSTISAVSGNNTIIFNALGEGAHSNCTITVTDASLNASTPLAVTNFEIDTTTPILSEVTPVSTPTSDTTPDYTFSSDEAGTITYGGSCSSSDAVASSGNNTVTFDALGDGTYADCTITVTDNASNSSLVLTISSFMIDSSSPVLAEVTSVTDPTNDTTPNYTFSSDEAGTITYGGSCSSSDAVASSGNNTVTFDALGDGTYADCTITVTDTLLNASAPLSVTSFEIDTTVPTLTEVTPVSTPTQDSTPEYTFSSDEAGIISYGGSCLSSNTSAVSGNNTIIFNALSDGIYSDCTVMVTDAASNDSSILDITSFTIDSPPVISEITPVNDPTGDTTPSYTFSSTKAGDITYGGSCSSSDVVASSGNNTVTFDALVEGIYSNCTITVTDSSALDSNILLVTSFEVDTTTPILSEVTPVSTPTSDTTPDYTFSSDEAGTITYGGDCSSVTTSAISGSNTVTFNTLSVGSHSNCTVTVTDAASNPSSDLEVTSFEIIDGTPPVLSGGSPSGSLSAGMTSADMEVTTDEGATCRYSTSSGIAYDSMTDTFGTTGTTSHLEEISGLTDGSSYDYYVRCEDSIGNQNSFDYHISFSVSEEIVEEINNDGELDVPKPDVEYDNDEEDLDSYFKKDKKIRFSEKVPDLAGGTVKMTKGSKTLKEEVIDDNGKWSFKVEFDETTEIRIKYYNSEGEEIASNKYRVKIDDEDPEFTDLPVVLTKRRGEKLWWEATDNKDISHYKYKINGKKTKTKDKFLFIPQDMSIGPHYIQVRAYDEAGNKETRSVLVWVRS